MYIGIQDSLRDKMYIGIPDSLRDREGDNAPGYNPLSDVVANLKICSEQRLDKKQTDEHESKMLTYVQGLRLIVQKLSKTDKLKLHT